MSIYNIYLAIETYLGGEHTNRNTCGIHRLFDYHTHKHTINTVKATSVLLFIRAGNITSTLTS